MTNKDKLRCYLTAIGANMFLYQMYSKAETKKAIREMADMTCPLADPIHLWGRIAGGFTLRERLDLLKEIIGDLDAEYYRCLKEDDNV